jgi:hypothetical protein
MANIKVTNPENIGLATVEASSTNDISDTFVIQYDAKCSGIAVEKPSTSGVAITCALPSGATYTLLSIGSGDAVTSGIYYEDRSIPLPDGTVLTVTTSGSVSGDKKITLMTERVDA